MTKQKTVETDVEKHMPRVMALLLMSSPPISISHQLFRRRYSNSREIVASSPSFSYPAATAPWRACLQAMYGDKCGELVCGYWDSKSEQRSILKSTSLDFTTHLV